MIYYVNNAVKAIRHLTDRASAGYYIVLSFSSTVQHRIEQRTPLQHPAVQPMDVRGIAPNLDKQPLVTARI